MLSEELTNELAGIIHRSAHRIRTAPQYQTVLKSEYLAGEHTLEGIEDAIAGLVMLHVQVRRGLV